MPLSITQALHAIDTHITPLAPELLPLELALGRITAQAYTATFDLPRFNNSAMDGYIVKVADAGESLPCRATIYAGDNPQMTLQAGEVFKIMTGAPIPQGGEAIVPIEHVTLHEERVTLPDSLKHDHFIRMRGEDIKAGTIFLEKGERVTAYAIAMLASQGITHILVTRTIKVAIFGTGDELRPHFEKIQPHQLYNSNTLMFLSRAKELGCEVRQLHSSADTLEALESAITSALDADIIITSGGVSVGDKDFTKEAFINCGMHIHFNKVDIKPGKPTVFGQIGNTAVVNLPGNPLASMVNYELFVRAIIRKMSGATAHYHGTIETTMGEALSLKQGKYTVILGRYNGKCFTPIKPQMPGMVSPMQQADGMLITLPQTSHLEQGDRIVMLPIAFELTDTQPQALFSH